MTNKSITLGRLVLAIMVILACACGGIAIALNANQSHPLTIIPVKVSYGKPANGYQDVTVAVAVKNMSTQLQDIKSLANDVTISIAGTSNTYSGVMEADGDLRTGFRFGYFSDHFKLPPGLVICELVYGFGEGGGDFEVTGSIPQNTTATKLEISGFSPIDLTSTNPSACEMDTSQYSRLPQSYAVASSRSSTSKANLKINAPTKSKYDYTDFVAICISVELQNQDKFDSFGVSDLKPFAISAHGTVEEALGQTNGLGLITPISAGPSQTSKQRYCYFSITSPSILVLRSDDFSVLQIYSFTF